MEQHIEKQQLNEDQPYFEPIELHDIHKITKAESIEKVLSLFFLENVSNRFVKYILKIQFQKTRKLGGVELIKPFEEKLVMDIKIKKNSFKQENERRRSDFEVSKKSFSLIKRQ